MVEKFEKGRMYERERIIKLIWDCYNAQENDCDHVFKFLQEILEIIGE